MPPRRHVTCAWGRDYTDVAPVRGVVIGPAAAQSLSVGVDVTALI
jgi:transglutaminase-like putative cysteine protease